MTSIEELVDRSGPLKREVLAFAQSPISGQPLSMPAEQRDIVLKLAADAALRHPDLVFRNPDRLARSWEMQAAERAAFIGHFGGDTVILDVDDVADRLMEYSAKRYSGAMADPMAAIVGSVPPWARDRRPDLRRDRRAGTNAHRSRVSLSSGTASCRCRSG